MLDSFPPLCQNTRGKKTKKRGDLFCLFQRFQFMIISLYDFYITGEAEYHGEECVVERTKIIVSGNKKRKRRKRGRGKRERYRYVHMCVYI